METYQWYILTYYGLLFLFYFFPFKVKNEEKAKQLLHYQDILFAIYIIHGLLDWIFGISFYGVLLDFSIEYFVPSAILIIRGVTSPFIKAFLKRRIQSLLVFCYWFFFPFICIFMYDRNTPIVALKYNNYEELYNGKYFRIEQGGGSVVLHGIGSENVRFIKKYFIFEHRFDEWDSQPPFSSVKCIEEKSNYMIFDAKAGGHSMSNRKLIYPNKNNITGGN